jgi:lipid A ethanolaminephosphotransferase
MLPAAIDRRSRHSRLGNTSISLLLAAYVLLLGNGSFWRALGRALGSSGMSDVPVVLAIATGLLALLWMIFCLPAWHRTAKPVWIVLLLLAAGAAYFMDSYGVVMDRVAIQSVLETDLREASEWLNWRMLPYAAGALLPSAWLLRLRLPAGSWQRQVAVKLVVTAIGVTVIVGGTASNFARLSSLARNHRELRHLINPTAVLQSAYGYARRAIAPRPTSVAAIDIDAHRGPSWSAAVKPRVLVLVVGESARASSFSLLGYERLTNPGLAVEDVVAFDNVRSCGTSTAVSLPCMFSDLGQAHYDDREARGRESLLDVLGHAGLRSLWLDNNTGSKNVAARSGQVSVSGANDPAFCNETGCFDDILAARLRELLGSADPPSLIVLHQKGSHGPSYFERYPASFRRFRPTCESNELADCAANQIINTYDNSILYTDHNLALIIGLLREHADTMDTAMLYVSDHGESTGEKGMYLHGAPDFMAPDEQTHVPMIVWFSPGFATHHGIDTACLRSHASMRLSHDNLFHSVLGLMDVRTRGYRPRLDLFAGCRQLPAGLAAAS